jgi:hypothetical protein
MVIRNGIPRVAVISTLLNINKSTLSEIDVLFVGGGRGLPEFMNANGRYTRDRDGGNKFIFDRYITTRA